MNNKPVAFVTGVRQFDPVMADTVLKVGTPLYTYLAKTLTDEEIFYLCDEILGQFNRRKGREFAKAILKKAQEK